MANYQTLLLITKVLQSAYGTDEPIFLTICKSKAIIKIGNSLPVETKLDKSNEDINRQLETIIKQLNQLSE